MRKLLAIFLAAAALVAGLLFAPVRRPTGALEPVGAAQFADERGLSPELAAPLASAAPEVARVAVIEPVPEPELAASNSPGKARTCCASVAGWVVVAKPYSPAGLRVWLETPLGRLKLDEIRLGSDGHFRFSGLPAGRAQMRVEGPVEVIAKPNALPFNLGAGDNYVLEWDLRSYCPIRLGVQVRLDGELLVGASVQARGTGKAPWVDKLAVTDQVGRANFELVETGEIDFAVQSPDQRTCAWFHDKVRLTEDRRLQLAFEGITGELVVVLDVQAGLDERAETSGTLTLKPTRESGSYAPLSAGVRWTGSEVARMRMHSGPYRVSLSSFGATFEGSVFVEPGNTQYCRLSKSSRPARGPAPR